MKLIKLTLVLVLTGSFTASAATNEIEHLLNFVANTKCQYERNGTMHTGSEAVKHIKKKYDYYKDDIKTTEDFIRLSATKSKMSGKHYKIHCNNEKPEKSQIWLLAEIHKFRLNK